MSLRKNDPTKSPVRVTIALGGVFGLGCWNLGRAIALWQQLPLLGELALTPNPAGRLLMAIGWGVLFVLLALLRWRHRPVPPLAIPLALTLYGLYHLGLLAFFVQSPVARQSWPVQTIGYLFAILFTVWALSRPGNHSHPST